MKMDIPHGHFERARELRNEATFPERRLWKYLSGEKAGLKFRRQHPIGPFVVDFYARQAALAVEVDGNFAHSTDEQNQYDRVRNDYMTELGLNVLRISAKEVNDNIDGVCRETTEICEKHQNGGHGLLRS